MSSSTPCALDDPCLLMILVSRMNRGEFYLTCTLSLKPRCIRGFSQTTFRVFVFVWGYFDTNYPQGFRRTFFRVTYFRGVLGIFPSRLKSRGNLDLEKSGRHTVHKDCTIMVVLLDYFH